MCLLLVSLVYSFTSTCKPCGFCLFLSDSFHLDSRSICVVANDKTSFFFTAEWYFTIHLWSKPVHSLRKRFIHFTEEKLACLKSAVEALGKFGEVERRDVKFSLSESGRQRALNTVHMQFVSTEKDRKRTKRKASQKSHVCICVCVCVCAFLTPTHTHTHSHTHTIHASQII